jgi:hypothetical protein
VRSSEALHAADLLDESSVKGNKSATISAVAKLPSSSPSTRRLIPQSNRPERLIARGSIFKEINTERTYQTDKWGVEADDTKNTPWMWVSYITQYATKWMTGCSPSPTSSADLFRTSMIKTASIGDRRRGEPRSPAARSRPAFYEEQNNALEARRERTARDDRGCDRLHRRPDGR